MYGIRRSSGEILWKLGGVFYRLDLAQGKATYLRQLNDPAVKASHCCGSARELEDGGWLVSWGDNPLVTAFDPEGRIVFRLNLAASTFRAVPVPPARRLRPSSTGGWSGWRSADGLR